MSAARPTPPAARQPGPDALRGLALLLILPVNGVLILEPAPAGPVDEAAAGLIRLLFEGKGYSLFAFLFGLGFALLLARGLSPLRYARRLAVLAAIGVAHGALLWPGDILLPYAVVGAALLAFGRASTRAVLGAAAAAIAIPVLVNLAAAVGGVASDSASGALPAGAGRWGALAAHYAGIIEYGWTVLGCMLAGLAAGRSGVLADPVGHRLLLRRLALWGLPIGLALSGAAVASGDGYAAAGLMALGGPVMGAGYVGAAAPLAARFSKRLPVRGLRAAGRMPLTNYLLQTVALAALASTGMAAGHGGTLLAGAAIFVLQAVASGAWLRRWQFGPAEWAWRWASYGGRPAMRDASGGGSRVAGP